MAITSISLDDPRLTTRERNALWRIALRLDHAQDYVPVAPLDAYQDAVTEAIDEALGSNALSDEAQGLADSRGSK
jgi:hypothetical protein